MFKLKRLTYAMGCVFVLNGCATPFQSKSVSANDFEIKPVTRINHAEGGPRIMYMLGRYYQGKVNYGKAIEAYQKALEKNPEYVEVHNGLGVIYSIQGKHELALQHFQKALQIAPEETYLHNNLGFAYLLQGRESDAAESLRQALRFDPANQRARSNLAVTFDRLGLHDEAEMLRLATTDKIEQQVAAVVDDHNSFENLNDSSVQKVVSDELLSTTEIYAEAKLIQVAPNVWNYISLPQDQNIAILSKEMQKANSKLEQISSTVWKFKASPQDPIVAFLANEIQKETKQVQIVKDQEPVPVALVSDNVRIEISNGNGVNGMAKNVSKFLELKGLNKLRLTNYGTFHKSRTEILYQPGNYDLARKISQLMPDQMELTESFSLRSDIKIKIILGRDYSNQKSFFNDIARMESNHPPKNSALLSKGLTPKN